MWVNQTEIKDPRIEFAINNVSEQGKRLTINLNLKVEGDCKRNRTASSFHLMLSDSY